MNLEGQTLAGNLAFMLNPGSSDSIQSLLSAIHSKGNEFTCSLVVVDELANFGVILGQDWFHDFNPNVDFDNDVVHIKSCSLTGGRIM